MNDDVRAVREQLAVLDRRAERAEVELLELLAGLDHALRVADADVLELERRARRRSTVPRPSGPPEGKSGEVEARPAHLDAARALAR